MPIWLSSGEASLCLWVPVLTVWFSGALFGACRWRGRMGRGEDRGKELGRERFFFFKGITTIIRAHPLVPPNPPPKTIILVGESQNMNLKPLKHSVYNVNYEKEIVISCVPSFLKHYCFVKCSQETYYVR